MTALAPTRPRKRWRSILGKLFLAGGGAGLGLILSEVILRLFDPGYSPLFLDIYRLDPHGLPALKPDTVRRHLTREWDVTVAVNSEGLRDRATPVPAGGGTVLAVGDSFAFGWGVELAESFLFVAEESLRPDAIRVVKAGIPGTGTSDQAAWLRYSGERYEPDLVVVAFFVGNDFVDVQMGGAAGQFTIEDGLMVRKSLTGEALPWFSRAANKLKRSSLVAQKVAEFAYTHRRDDSDAEDSGNPALIGRDRWLEEFFKIHLRTPPPETVRAVNLTLQALDDIREWCRSHQASLLLLVLPRSFQIYDRELAEWQSTFGWSGDQIELARPQRILSEWAASRNVAVLDLLPVFRAHHPSRPDERLYFHPDSHLNAKGHRLTGEQAAETIRRFFREARKNTPASSRAG